jgi:predicted RNase H-like HicB family nuclease
MVARMTTHRVVFSMDDNGWWFAKATEVPGAHSDGQTIARARANIKEAIAGILDLPEGAEADMSLAERFELPAGSDEARQAVWSARAEYEAAEAQLRSATEHALEIFGKEFPDLGLRDLAELLGVSFQRVAQLRPGQPRGGRRAAPTSV